MDNEQDLIKERMEETRVHLTDQIETLESTLKETVQTTLGAATHVVENVEHTVETVKEAVEGSAEAVKETVSSTLDSVKESVAEAVDLRGHVQRHPWAMLGGAVVLGFLGGQLLGGGQRRRRDWRDSAAFGGELNKLRGMSLRGGASPARAAEPALRTEEKREEGPSLLSKLGDTFGDEMDKLKGLALGAVFGVLRDMITTSAPEQMKSQLSEVINDVTTKLGGKPIRGPLIDKTRHEQHRGGDHGQRHETEMGGPVGAAHRPGETGLG